MFYMVFLEGGGASTYKHGTFELAEKEAKRLTELTSRQSYILEAVSSVRLPDKFIVENLRKSDQKPVDDDLPF